MCVRSIHLSGQQWIYLDPLTKSLGNSDGNVPLNHIISKHMLLGRDVTVFVNTERYGCNCETHC